MVGAFWSNPLSLTSSTVSPMDSTYGQDPHLTLMMLWTLVETIAQHGNMRKRLIIRNLDDSLIKQYGRRIADGLGMAPEEGRDQQLRGRTRVALSNDTTMYASNSSC